MFYAQQLLYAFLATIGFAVIFNSPKDTIIKSGLAGTVGWLVYYLTNELTGSPIAGSFLGASTVGLLGEIFAKIFKKPSTTFTIPGIIPLVPGAGIYYTMLSLTEKQFLEAADSGSQTILVSVALASGIIVSSSINRAVMKYKEEKRRTLEEAKENQGLLNNTDI